MLWGGRSAGCGPLSGHGLVLEHDQVGEVLSERLLGCLALPGRQPGGPGHFLGDVGRGRLRIRASVSLSTLAPSQRARSP